MPTWPADFLDAHARHWEDGERLCQARRWANADYLYGLSAECGLKALMARTGMRTWRTGSPGDLRYRVHVDKLWPVFLSFAHGRPAGKYVTLLPPTSPFRKWHVSQRYAHQNLITKALAQAHRDGARGVRSVVHQARKDGVLP